MAIGIQDQYFGTEIEMTGITRQRAAEKVAELFGTRAVCDGGYYGVWSVTDQEGKKWKFMYDGISFINIYFSHIILHIKTAAAHEFPQDRILRDILTGDPHKIIQEF